MIHSFIDFIKNGLFKNLSEIKKYSLIIQTIQVLSTDGLVTLFSTIY